MVAAPSHLRPAEGSRRGGYEEYHPPFSLFVHDANVGAGSVVVEGQLLDFVAHARRV